MINIGNKNVQAIYVGNISVSKVYLGDVLIWDKSSSCFSSGYWIEHLPWLESDTWVENK